MASNQFDSGMLTFREFPDQETYIKYDSDLTNRQIVIIACLDNPNVKFLPLVFALQTARELGASNIGLVVPYLPYMRQDKQFLSGEAVTSKYFSKMLSDSIDWLITIDPHLHRYHSLNEIYQTPTTVLHANELISNYIQQHVASPLIIGPDSESEQWVATIAKTLHAPYKVLEKVRHGDDIVCPPNYLIFRKLVKSWFLQKLLCFCVPGWLMDKIFTKYASISRKKDVYRKLSEDFLIKCIFDFLNKHFLDVNTLIIGHIHVEYNELFKDDVSRKVKFFSGSAWFDKSTYLLVSKNEVVRKSF